MKKYNKKQAQLRKKKKTQGNYLKLNMSENNITIKYKWDIYSLFLIFIYFTLLLFKIFSQTSF